MKLENNFLNEKFILISSQNVSQNCLIITKHSARCKAVWCKALAIVIRLQ